jgi:hypothetical protein
LTDDQKQTRLKISTENAVEAPWLTPSEEIHEGAISREDDGFRYFGISRG